MKELHATAAAPDLSKVVDLYIRVSTQEQADEGYSIGEQETRLRSYCDAYGFRIHAVHIDPGYSGSNLERPGIQELIQDVKGGLCKKVLVWKLDRLSRSQKDTMTLLEDVFLANGCNFISIMESFDTSTPFGRCMVGILSAFAQMERENIRIRTMMGRQASVSSGNYSGGAAPLGYRIRRTEGGGRTLEPDPEWAPRVLELFNRLAAGEPVFSITADFCARYGYGQNTKNPASSLSAVARNPVYYGVMSYGGKLYPGKHPPIVPEDLWNRVASVLQQTHEKYKRRSTPSGALLTGLLRCGDCGARITARIWYTPRTPNAQPIRRYVCYSVCRTSRAMVRSDNCQNRQLYTMEELNSIVLGEIRKLSLDPDAFQAALHGSAPGSSDAAAYSGRLADIEKQINRLLNLFQSGAVELPDIQDRLQTLKAERAEVSRLLDTSRAPARLSPAAAWDSLQSFGQISENGSREELYKLVHLLIDRIVVLNDDITIYWAFC